LVGFNGNRDRVEVDGVHKGSFGANGNVLVAFNGGVFLAGFSPVASAILGSVFVVSFSVKATVLDDVFETIVHETTIAALVAFGTGAVDELLLREGNKFARGDLSDTFDRASGREGPA